MGNATSAEGEDVLKAQTLVSDGVGVAQHSQFGSDHLQHAQEDGRVAEGEGTSYSSE